MGRKSKPVKLLGTSNQNLKINSSVALNVTENHKEVGRDQTLHEECQQCKDLVRVNSCPHRQPQRCNLCQHHFKSSEVSTPEHNLDKSKSTTNLLCQSQRNSFRISNVDKENCVQLDEKSAERKSVTQANDTRDLQDLEDLSKANLQKKKSKLEVSVNTGVDNECDSKLLEHRTLDVGTQACSDQSCQTPPLYEKRKKNRRHRHNSECNHKGTPSPEEDSNGYKEKKRKSNRRKHYEDEMEIDNKYSKRKVKQHLLEIDHKFIKDIIRKHYTPKEIYGRRQSDLSQISVAVCRDIESSLSEPTPEVCRCEYEPRSLPPTHSHNYKRCDKNRNAYDNRFLPSHRVRSRSRYLNVDPYNDVDLYDMIPVKENSHHRSRRKTTFVNNSSGCDVYREVPPSPRTHLPRLNLEAQVHTNYEDFLNFECFNEMNTSKNRHKKRTEYNESETTSVTTQRETAFLKPAKIQTSMNLYQQSNPLFSRLQCNPVANIPGPENLHTNDACKNSPEGNDNIHSTDKSLSELKEILQNFLDEIKKKSMKEDKAMDITKKEQSSEVIRSSTANTNCAPMKDARGEAEITMNSPRTFMPDKSTSPYVPGITSHNPLPNTTGTIPCIFGPLPKHVSDMTCPLSSMPSGPQNACSFNTAPHCTLQHLPPTLSRACCYSSIPICPGVCSAIHCCHLHHIASNNACQNFYIKNKTERNSETEELIKEIYNIVTLNPIQRDRDNLKQKTNLTSRSVGANSNGMEGGISQLRSYSKSCEAIGSQNVTQGSYATRSDTVLEKLHLDMTQSEDDCPVISRKREDQSKKKKTITNVIKSLFRKIKILGADTTPESYYVEKDSKAPFRQEVTDYMMTGQEYFQPSSARPSQRGQYRECCHHIEQNPKHPSPHACHVHHPPRFFPETSSSTYTPQDLHKQTIPEYEPTYGPQGFYEPTYGPQGYSWYGIPPYLYPPKRTFDHEFEVPLCLREIEVKSTGTQSEKKVSFLEKLSRKGPKVSQPLHKKMNTEKSKFNQRKHFQSKQFNKPKNCWQKFQENIEKDINDQMASGFQQRNKVGDNKKVQKKLLKKMIYKKNSFSPSNLSYALCWVTTDADGTPNEKIQNRLFPKKI